jgi:hypothetical protein
MSKVAFAELDEELVVKESLKNQLTMSNVIIKCFTIDQYIIHEYQHKFSLVLAKCSIHKTLKGGRGISKFKGHDSKLKMSMMCLECSVEFI